MAQAPANTPALGMGDPLFDRSSFGPDCPPALVDAMMSVQAVMAACGWLCPVRGTGTAYQNAVLRYDGSNWILYAARPDTPLNPDTVSLTSGGSAIIVELDNVVVNATTTTINFSTNFSVVDAGSGQVDVDVTGGGGGSYTSSDPIVLTGSDFSLSYSTGLTLSGGALIVDIGDGLEAVGNKVQAKAHTYIDVGPNGIAVDLTEVASYNGSGDQYLRNNAGTFQWATLPADGVGYDEIQEEGSALTKRAKLNFISERVTAADDAGNSRTNVTFEYFVRVYGTTTTAVTAADATFDVDGVSVIQGDMPELTAGELEITNAAKIPIDDETEAEFRWNQDAGQWQTEPLKCHMVMGLATAAVSGAAFSIDNIELVCGSDPRTDPSDAAETLSVENPFAWDIDNNGSVLATKKANGDWIAIQAACPA